MATIKSFEDLEIWKEGIEIAADDYDICKKGELSKDFGLRDQVRRSAVSIPANIAEWFEYDNQKDFKRFLTYSKGSGGELRSHLTVLQKVGYISEEVSIAMQMRLKVQARKTSKLIKYLNEPQRKT